VKPESKLYQKFKKNTPSILWTRLESWSSFGVPDLLGYNNLCGFFMVELKFTQSNKIKFSPHQILFHTTRNERNFILVEQALRASRSTVKLFASSEINNLLMGIDKAAPLAVDDFKLITKILINQKN
jgi:Holliday junction resolvase